VEECLAFKVSPCARDAVKIVLDFVVDRIIDKAVQKISQPPLAEVSSR
jgi:hypothetical protein